MSWCISTLEGGVSVSDLVVQIDEVSGEDFHVSDHSGKVLIRVDVDDEQENKMEMLRTLRRNHQAQKAIEISGETLYDEKGCMFLNVDKVSDDAQDTDPLFLTPAPGIHSENEWHRLFGLILIRQNKCLLARSDKWKGLTFPAMLADGEISPKVAAMEVMEELLEIDQESIHLKSTLSPTMLYNPKSSPYKKSMALLYGAYASYLPEASMEVQKEDEHIHDENCAHEEEDKYAWFTYDEALQILETEEEKEALREFTRKLHRARRNDFIESSFGEWFGLNAEDDLKVESLSESLTVSENSMEIETNNENGSLPFEKLPVTVLSGFLGAGKTTLLESILTSETQTERVAVIVNDMSEVNVDFAKVKLVHRDEEMIEMSNGCICCTLREDLLIEVGNLARAGKFDYLLIESTGISEPLPVAETFTFTDENTGKSLSDIAELDTMVTVVDASSFMKDLNDSKKSSLEQRGLQAGPEDKRHVSDLLIDQLEFANVIIVNKCDLVNNKEDLKSLRGVIKKLNPDAKILESVRGNVPLNAVMGTKLFNFEKARENPGWLRELRGSHVPETEEYGISSFVFRSNKPFHPVRLQKLLAESSDVNNMHNPKFPLSSLVRSKGIMWLGSEEGWTNSVVWSHAGHLFVFEWGEVWWASIPKDDWPEGVEQAVEKHWKDDVYGDRHQEIVLIGINMDKEKIKHELEMALLTNEELKSAIWNSSHCLENLDNSPAIVVKDPHSH